MKASISLVSCTLKMSLSGHGSILKRFVTKLAMVPLGHDYGCGCRRGLLLVKIPFRLGTNRVGVVYFVTVRFGTR